MFFSFSDVIIQRYKLIVLLSLCSVNSDVLALSCNSWNYAISSLFSPCHYLGICCLNLPMMNTFLMSFIHVLIKIWKQICHSEEPMQALGSPGRETRQLAFLVSQQKACCSFRY